MYEYYMYTIPAKTHYKIIAIKKLYYVKEKLQI